MIFQLEQFQSVNFTPQTVSCTSDLIRFTTPTNLEEAPVLKEQWREDLPAAWPLSYKPCHFLGVTLTLQEADPAREVVLLKAASAGSPYEPVSLVWDSGKIELRVREYQGGTVTEPLVVEVGLGEQVSVALCLDSNFMVHVDIDGQVASYQLNRPSYKRDMFWFEVGPQAVQAHDEGLMIMDVHRLQVHHGDFFVAVEPAQVVEEATAAAKPERKPRK